jgi:hypothetical protein
VSEQRIASLEEEILRLAERGLTGRSEEGSKLAKVEQSLRTAGLEILPDTGFDSPQGLAERVLKLSFCLEAVRQLSQYGQ